MQLPSPPRGLSSSNLFLNYVFSQTISLHSTHEKLKSKIAKLYHTLLHHLKIGSYSSENNYTKY